MKIKWVKSEKTTYSPPTYRAVFDYKNKQIHFATIRKMKSGAFEIDSPIHKSLTYDKIDKLGLTLKQAKDKVEKDFKELFEFCNK